MCVHFSQELQVAAAWAGLRANRRNKRNPGTLRGGRGSFLRLGPAAVDVPQQFGAEPVDYPLLDGALFPEFPSV